MSTREMAKGLIDKIPDGKLLYVIAYLQGAAIPDEVPNAETIAAMAEVDQMIASGSGEHFSGSTGEFFQMLMES